jgi:hypothetical protein
MLESGLVDYAAEREGLKVRKNTIRVKGNLSAQHDALATDSPVGVEAKAPGSMDGWGEDGSSDIPDDYAAQVTHQASVSDLDTVYVPVFFVGIRRDIRLYRCPVTVAERDAYIEFMEKWFEKHVKGDTPPPVAPTLDVAWLIKRTPGKVIPATPEQVLTWQAWNKHKEDLKIVAKSADTMKAELLAAMGDAEGIEYEGKRVIIQTVTRKEYTVKEQSYKQLREVKAV